MIPDARGLRRRHVLAALAFAPLGISAARAAATLADDASLPRTVPPGTRLVIGDPTTQKALELSGELKNLPFTVEWANISGGPQTIEAFRAGALDVGAVADIPPVHATWTGLQVRIVAARFRKDPLEHPTYAIGTSPASKIQRLEDIRGKKVAFSPGQAQGALVLRLLKTLGLGHDDVTLVELPSVGDAYTAALASGLVDAAPIAEANKQRFIQSYAKDGARALPHGLRDDPWYLYLPKATLQDPGKAAAVAAYVRAWGRALRWADTHPEEWAQGYYVKDQGLRIDPARALVAANGLADVPTDWTGAIARQQETNDLLAAELKKPVIPAASLFDRRFEGLAGEAYAQS